MEVTTFPALYALIRDPSIHSFTAQLEGRYISFIKAEVGTATHVYGHFGMDVNSLFDPRIQYSLEAILSDGTVYTLDTLDFFRRWKDWNPDSGVMSLSDFLSKLNAQAIEIYEDWYNSLPADAELLDYQRQACANDARRIVIEKGPNDESMLDAPEPMQFVIDVSSAIKVLSGITTLEEFFESWKAENRFRYNVLKTSRLLTQELVRDGGGVSEEDLRMAEALWPLDVKFVNVTFEHDGNAITGKVKLDSVRDAILLHRFPYSTEFSSLKEDETVREKLTGKKSGDISVDYIQSIVSRGKTVYVRSDNH